MQFHPIFIADYDCLSPAGHGAASLLESLFAERSHLRQVGAGQGLLPLPIQDRLLAMRLEKPLKEQDKTVLMGHVLARAMSPRFRSSKSTAGLIIGSSRGPTETLENVWNRFAEGQRLSTVSSPTTTASSLVASLARELAWEGPSFSLSAACSTGLYAVIQGLSSLLAGLCETALVGGIEASNTEFTLEMLRAAKVLGSDVDKEFPCRPGHSERSGMILSEGAALLQLVRDSSDSAFQIIGWGTATESGSLTGVTGDGKALQSAVRRALKIADLGPEAIDFIVGHGAGTRIGDKSEWVAYQQIFEQMPPVVWHKWCTGHMLGASAALSVILACEHLKSAELPPHPYFPDDHPMRASISLNDPRIALITSMGFGGSACALLVKNLL